MTRTRLGLYALEGGRGAGRGGGSGLPRDGKAGKGAPGPPGVRTQDASASPEPSDTWPSGGRSAATRMGH